MVLLAVLAAAALAAPDIASGERPGELNPNATELFDRDPTLNAWALARFDANHDGWLTLFEAQTALAAFKQLADGNRDGRVTVAEFQNARTSLTARFNLPVALAASAR